MWFDWRCGGWIDILERDSVALIGIYDGFVDMNGHSGVGAYFMIPLGNSREVGRGGL